MSPGDEKQQRRKHDRAQVAVDVRIRADSFSSFIDEQATTLSAGGMFIATADPKPAGSTIAFEFVLADDGARLFAGTAEVRWARSKGACRPGEKPGMGIQFLSLDDDSRRLIDRIVESRRAKEAPRGAPRKDAREIFQDMDENELLAGLGEEEPGGRQGREAAREDDIDTALGRLFGEGDDEPAEIQDTGKFPPPADVPPVVGQPVSEDSWLGAEDVDHVLDRAIPLPSRGPDDDGPSRALPNEPDVPASLEEIAGMDFSLPAAADERPPADTVVGTAADAYFEDAEQDTFEDQVARAVERFREKDGPPAAAPSRSTATGPSRPLAPPPPPEPRAAVVQPTPPPPSAPGAFAFEEEPHVAPSPRAAPPSDVEEVEEVEVYFEDDGGGASVTPPLPPAPAQPPPPAPSRLAVPAAAAPAAADLPPVRPPIPEPPPTPAPPRAPAPSPTPVEGAAARAADLRHPLAESLETLFPEERAPSPPVQRRLPLESPGPAPRRAEEVSAGTRSTPAAAPEAPKSRRSVGVILVVVGVAVLAGAAFLVSQKQDRPGAPRTPRTAPPATVEDPTPDPGSDPGGETPVVDPGATPTEAPTGTAPLPGTAAPPDATAPLPEGTTTAPATGNDGPTHRFLAITTQVSGGAFVLTARGDGRRTTFQTMKLDAPPRYVVDVPGVKSDDRRVTIDVNAPMITRVRVGHDPDKVRFVLDVLGSPEMDVVDENGTLRVTLR